MGFHAEWMIDFNSNYNKYLISQCHTSVKRMYRPDTRATLLCSDNPVTAMSFPEKGGAWIQIHFAEDGPVKTSDGRSDEQIFLSEEFFPI
jgi:hypothetical protein